MNKKLIYFIILLSLSIYSCKSTDPLVKQQEIEALDEKIMSNSYTFNATSAYPMGGRSIQLTSNYMLSVGKDTIKAYLPYFGRAYSAPFPTEDGGIKFTSTNFRYTISEKKKGIYRVAIEIKDHPNNYQLSLLIGETGSGTLHVTQMRKQNINFAGEID